jgi:Ca2+-binding RTX toxin-like protein
VIEGSEGDDTLFGGTGDDFVSDIAGATYANGGEGNDTLFTVDGDDKLIGGPGDDTMDAAGGADKVRGGFGLDVMWAGTGDDKVVSWEDDGVADEIHCGDGTDIAYVRANDVVINDPMTLDVCETVNVVT